MRITRRENQKIRDIINNSQGELVSSIPKIPRKSRKSKRNSYYLKKLNRKLKYSRKAR
jgi:protein-arginine kinase activator protein McsA